MPKIYTSLFLFHVFLNSFSQNEFYNNGSIVSINGKVNSSVATLRVNGSITNNNGYFNNDAALIELEKDWTNTSSTYYYVSTGIERFIGNFNQTINGNWNGTTSNRNQFYDLKINKSSTPNEYVNLNTNVYVNSNGSLEFEGTKGIIRTDVSSHTDNGSLYTKELFLRNDDPAKLIGNSWTNVLQFSNTGGATTKYIEGKLRLAVSQNNIYRFPIGVANTSLDGMEAVSLTFAATPTFSTDMLAYIQPAATISYTSDLITNGQSLFYDIGSLPATTPANQFQNCVGTPDGHDDIAIIDAAITHEWILTATAATANYNLSVHPGSVLDNLSYVAMGSPCNSVFALTKYIARNGKIGGDDAVGPTTNYWNPGVTGLYQKPNGNLLSNQTLSTPLSSKYRIFGTTNQSNTSLPVELVNLKAMPINNEFIKIDWITASEFNNKGFVLERSYNNKPFVSIAFIVGNGNSNSTQNYYFDDRTVDKGITYYYRLKQIDFDDNFNYSYIVNAKLIQSGIESITVFPNPSTTNSTIQFLSSKNEDYKVDVFNDIGQNMYVNNVSVKANTVSTLDLPTQNWVTGIYIIKVLTNDKQIKGIKFIKN